MTLYEVIGCRAYLEFRPGARFETTLPPDQERRAIACGAITVIQESPVALQPGTVRLADGWPPTDRQED